MHVRAAALVSVLLSLCTRLAQSAGLSAADDFEDFDKNGDDFLSFSELNSAYNRSVGDAYGQSNANEFRSK